ncbi:Thiamin ABC transporter, transmembrane component [Serinicoccus hydrothermalis]|uniref:Thiamin ABC transporter, transmembrane component n=1 Tax=Serinicoccus hydrothermalis TaxID=1758689 RepID=A0A1B1NEF7_9MICO|nr:iron ABC transporter permease [Serinicoccus hydrothermalis]ANS79827.1 Thiamin ABC transporter, transmembrane component [Serinicoccus hydrothermalis]
MDQPAARRARRGRRAYLSGPGVALGLAAVIPLTFLTVFFALPVGGMLARGLWPEGRLDLSAVPEVLGRARTLRVLTFTLVSSLAGTVVTLLLGIPVAFVLYRLRFPGRTLLRAVVVMPFVLPTVVVGVMFRSLLSDGGPLGGLGLDGTWVPILLAFVFFNLAVVVRTVGGLWEGMDRRAEESAATLGASPWQVWRTVTLPALAPGVISAGTLVFLFCSTAFGVVLTLGGLRYGTVETEIYLLTVQFLDLQGAAVLSLLQLAAVVAMLAVAARARNTREQALRRVGARASARAPRRDDIPALVVTAVVVAFVLLPVGTLVARSLRVGQGWGLDHYRALTDPEATSALRVSVTEAMANSLRTAVDATVLAMVLGLIVAVVVSRRPRQPGWSRAVSVLDGAFMLPLGISAVTVGFGFLITLDRPPLDLRTSPILVPIAQAMVALPLVVRTLAPVLRSVDPRQREAAAALGASPWRAAWTAEAPVLARPLLAATGFAFAVSLGEFGATSFLARPDRPTVPVVIYQLISRPGADHLGMALAASVLLALVTVVVMGVVERLRVGSVGAF